MTAPFEQIQQLSIADRLKLVEEIWDGIGASEEPLILQDWHEDEIARRAAKLNANPQDVLTRDELWKRIDDG